MGTRAATWLAWSLVALSVILFVGGFALSRTARLTDFRVQNYGVLDVIFTLAMLLTFAIVGAIVASHRPSNPIGWIFCTMGLLVGFGTFAGGYAEFWGTRDFGPRSLGETAAWFASWWWTLLIFIPTTFLLLLFPDGRLPSPRWRPVAWCAGLGIGVFVVGYALEAGPLGDFPQMVNPYGVDSPIVDIVGVAAGVVTIGSMVASALSVIVRARSAGRVERQQIKWLAYGGAVVVVTIFAGGTISIWSASTSIGIISLALLGVPVCTGFAIVRYRLYDIDIIINRTLVYAPLSAMLALIYVGGVVAMQAAFRALTGQESTLAVVASTLAIAALFNPLRRRVQTFVDRRFYRRKYNARKTLEAFSSKLRDETDLEALDDELVGVVRKTMQPSHVSLWLRAYTGVKGAQGKVMGRRRYGGAEAPSHAGPGVTENGGEP
jgi:hypothetical protein